MKRFLAFLLAVEMIVFLCVTGFAAINVGSDDFYSQVGNDYTVVSKTVKTKKNTYRVTGYSHSSEAREVFRLMNLERAAEGLKKLTWESDLVQPAIQRALEQELSKSHTRPDGSKGLSVSSKANGENLAGGDTSAYDVMEGWMNSPSHRDNILDTDYTSVAVACVETENMVYWVQLFHADVKQSGSASTAAKSPAKSEEGSNTSRGANVASDGSVSSKAVIADLTKASAANNKVTAVTVKNAETIAPAALKAIADCGTANKKTVSLVVNTTAAGAKTVQGQIALNPANFINRKENLKLGVYVDSGSTSSVRKKLSTWYSNEMSIIKMEQTGAFGAGVSVAAKANLTKLDTNKLVFYTYDAAANKIAQIETPDYSIDKSNYLRFKTTRGGYIIVTDKKLTKKQ